MLLVGEILRLSWNLSIVKSGCLGSVFAAGGVRGWGLREYTDSGVPAYVLLSGPILGLGTASKRLRVQSDSWCCQGQKVC